jgi:hypothetical protein
VGRVTAVHNLLGLASIAGALAVVGAAGWSVITGWRSGGRRDHRFAVDRAVLAVLLLVAAAGVTGLARLLAASGPADPLHFVYGPAAFLSVPIAIWIEARAPAERRSRLRRDIWTAGGGIVLVGVGLRLLATG